MLGPSFVSGGQQVFEFVRMMAHNEVCLRCAQLANASRVLGNLGDDILSKITLKAGTKNFECPPSLHSWPGADVADVAAAVAAVSELSLAVSELSLAVSELSLAVAGVP